MCNGFMCILFIVVGLTPSPSPRKEGSKWPCLFRQKGLSGMTISPAYPFVYVYMNLKKGDSNALTR